MNESIHCNIQIKGHLSHQWSDWFGGLTIENRPDGNAVISGVLPDQAALYGVLDRMRDLGVTIISLNCATPGTVFESVPENSI